ncbi:transglycosylase SLT domain-containing protein [Ruegeria sp. HKCCD7318]|uniref:transglycosylase SLT domain-containing protein n=1 Tax=Ruegeria sp. HKCCD7318 TaxID=2683014 RepID=UPI0014908DED|nr:transglycosylase SLT domain-containing protein [Ruegeria sp. HKCCD7318]NOE35577.1 transglycosylase SLT domain-containing protein [Ruegeria sp. HKCCD7318]
MPIRKLSFFIMFLLGALAEAVFAAPNAHTRDLCDQAAQRAALSEGVPLDVLRAISRVETGRTLAGHFSPWPWTINAEGQGYWFTTEDEAKAHVFKIFKAGARSFDVGCFQINYRWHGKDFRSIDAGFDPDENASYAARFLKALYTELGTWPAAAGAYHSRTESLAKAYTGRFQAVLAQLSGETSPRLAAMSRDPFTGTGTPLIPLRSSVKHGGALGSLVPTAGAATAFIAFN